MKKFNIKTAKFNELITKNGKEAKLLYSERASKNFPLVVIIDNMKVEFYTIEGKVYLDKDSEFDLMIK